MGRAATWGRRLGILLLAAGLLGAASLQASRSFERWAVRGGQVRSEAEALFDVAPSPTRRTLLGTPQEVLLLRPSLVSERYRDPVLGEVAVVPNAAFTFDQGVVQDKSLVLFARCALASAGGGLLLWLLMRRVS